MIFDKEDFESFDPELWAAIHAEEIRQQQNIELIASENIVSKAVMAAQGSVLTNKYAEGYPGKRYYGGTEAVDVVENLAIDRAKELFGAKICQCSTSLRFSSQCCSLYGINSTRRYSSGNGFKRWWSFDARSFSQFFRKNLSFCPLWGKSSNRAFRL